MRKLFLALVLTTTVFDQSFMAQSFLEILDGTILPEVTFCCPDTPQNRTQIVHEIVLLYAAFLSPKLHEEETKKRLRSHGMWLDLTPVHAFPSQEQIDIFIDTLETAALEELAQENYTRFSMDYGPDSPVLRKAFKTANIDNYSYKLLPYKSLTCLKSFRQELYLRINLSGPPL